MWLEGNWFWRPAGDHVCSVENSTLSNERHLKPSETPFLGKLGGWFGLRRLDLDIFDNNMIDQSEACVGCECILNAINPNASKKPLTYHNICIYAFNSINIQKLASTSKGF
jgi:hypothetical protein